VGFLNPSKLYRHRAGQERKELTNVNREEVDLTAPHTFDNSHKVYGELREQGAVHWNESLRGWVLTHHRDVKAALKDSRLSVEKLESFAHRAGGDAHSDVQVLARALADWMVFKDPPRHALLRRAMQNAFMARDVPVLEPVIQKVVDDLLSPLIPLAGERRSMDLISAFAQRAPAIVIADLFGLPSEERMRLNAWSRDLGEFVLGSTDSPERRERAAAAVRAMTVRFHDLVNDHRTSPRDDFTALLIRDGTHLTDDEIVHTLILVLFAGHETTANLITNGLLTLINTPTLMTQVVNAPDLMEPAIEEFLRLEGPVHMVSRLAKEPVEYAGVQIAAGDRLHLALNAANRDPQMFEDSEAIDLDRRRFQHVSFGPGTHMCLGAPLARLIGRIALNTLLARLQRFELATDTLTWRNQLIAHGLAALPVSYECRDIA
jgi:cytochrome P450